MSWAMMYTTKYSTPKISISLKIEQRIYIVGFLKAVSNSSVFDFPIEELKKPGYLPSFKKNGLRARILEKHVSDDYHYIW